MLLMSDCFGISARSKKCERGNANVDDQAVAYVRANTDWLAK